MAYRYLRGFTIIETSLVLAVTGLLVAMVLTGIGSSLNHERYTDAVNQTVDFFRNRYSSTASVINNRSTDESCGAGGITTLSGGQSRGASDCLVLGSVVRSTDGQTMKVYRVIARHDPSDDAGIRSKTSTQILDASSLQQGGELSQYSIEWGSSLLKPGTNNHATFSLMVVRVPVSGTVATYASSSSTIKVTDLVHAPQSDTRLCIDQRGFFGVGIDPMGVLIQRGATNTTGVQPITSGECV